MTNAFLPTEAFQMYRCDDCGVADVARCSIIPCGVEFCTGCCEGWKVYPGRRAGRLIYHCPYCVKLQVGEDEESQDNPNKRKNKILS